MRRFFTLMAGVGIAISMSTAAWAGTLWGTGSPDWGSGASGPSPVIFQFDTSSETITKTLSLGVNNWAFIGPYPDAGLDYYNGTWYATSWGYSDPPKKQGSLVFTSPDIMTTNFTQVGTGYSGVKGIGMIDGWEFDEAGNLFAVTWYDNGIYSDATTVYQIDTTTWTATALYDLSSQLPAEIISLDGLSEVVPEPTTLVIWSVLGTLGIALGWWRNRRRAT